MFDYEGPLTLTHLNVRKQKIAGGELVTAIDLKLLAEGAPLWKWAPLLGFNDEGVREAFFHEGALRYPAIERLILGVAFRNRHELHVGPSEAERIHVLDRFVIALVAASEPGMETAELSFRVVVTKPPIDLLRVLFERNGDVISARITPDPELPLGESEPVPDGEDVEDILQ